MFTLMLNIDVQKLHYNQPWQESWCILLISLYRIQILISVGAMDLNC